MSEEQGVGIADVAESGIVNDRAFSVIVLVSNFLIVHARVKTKNDTYIYDINYGINVTGLDIPYIHKVFISRKIGHFCYLR